MIKTLSLDHTSGPYLAKEIVLKGFLFLLLFAFPSHVHMTMKAFKVLSLEIDTLTPVQILGQSDCISHGANTLWKGINLNIHYPGMGR